jgi:capsular polysaccharide biosynthesis protein
MIRPDNFFSDSFGPNDRDSVNIDTIIEFVRRGWRLCLVWISVAVCAGIVFTIFSHTYYTADVSLLLDDHAARPVNNAVGQVGANDPAYVDSQVQLLLSDEVVGRVVDQNQLVESKEFGKGHGGLYTRIIGYLGFERAIRSPRYATITNVKRALSVRRVGLTNVVEIRFTSQHPEEAATIANAIAQNYIEDQRELNIKAIAGAKALAIAQQANDYSLVTPDAGDQARAKLREQSRAEAYQSLYKGFLQQAQTAQQQFPAVARVITAAQPPTERSWPRALLILAAAAAGGALGGIAHALLRHLTDNRLMTAEDVHRSTDIERIITVPRMSWHTSEESGQESLQPAYVRWSARFSEAMGKAAVWLHGLQRQRGALTIGVVAPTEGAGASSVAAHLAKVIAESGQRTLLVDANWRKSLAHPPVPNSGPALKQSFYTWVDGEVTNAEVSNWWANPAQRIISGVRAKIPALKAIGISGTDDTKHSENVDDVPAGSVEVAWTTHLPLIANFETHVPASLAGTLGTIHLEPEQLDVLVLRARNRISELNAALSIIKTLQSQDKYDCVIVDFHSADQTADLEASVRWGGVMAVVKKVIVVAEAGQTTSQRLRDFMQLVPRKKVAGLVLNKA